ncbi:MAG: NAD-dependent protein deacetylase [Chromatiaceae bacterium]
MDPQLQALSRFLSGHPRLVVLTGAGVSTGSGIPDYRDRLGRWKRPAPVQYGDFLASRTARQRYWARSLVGWPWFESAAPNASHRALAALERAGQIQLVITQNVDRLHQHAGADRVIDLHGRLDRLVCLGCGAQTPRAPLQRRLAEENPRFAELAAEMAPDGDADLGDLDVSGFRVPGCDACGGLLKPDVVFFGENVPSERVAAGMAGLLAGDGLLVCGTSLMVYSGYRFCRAAAEAGLPIAAINLGSTRADDLLDLKVEAACQSILPALVDVLGC